MLFNKRLLLNNIFIFFLTVIICNSSFAQNWQLINPVYPTTETVVAGFSVADYGATGDGTTDVTAIFQARLNALGTLGGGTLWVPSGKYVIAGNLTIPKGVILRGDWQKPIKGQPIGGTILMAYAGRGDTSAAAFITQQPESGVENIAIWYPEQLPDNIVPYPSSILFGQSGYFGNDFCNARNITLVNSYLGVTFSLLNGGTCPVMIGIYGTPLSTGCMIDNIVDVGRIENVDFSPAYWEGSGLPNSPSRGSYAESWIRQHGTGILMRRDDWTYTSFISVEGYNIGFHAAPSIASIGAIPNGHNYGMTFTNCNYGIYFDVVSNVGIMFARVNMVNCTNGIYIGPGATVTNGAAQFHTCTIDAGANAVYTDSSSSARLMMEHCTITRGKVNIGGGTFMPSDCDFNNTSPQIILQSNSRGIITGNRFKITASIKNNSPFQCAIDNSALTLKAMPSFPNIVTETHAPTRLVFYNATLAPYNAKNNNTTDNTTAIQNALNQASTDGGGIVFLPPGKYLVNGTLTIPSNVELKGASDIGAAPAGQGTILETTANSGNATGTPFIKVSANAGVRGLTIDYPNQTWTGTPSAYPYAIQATGINVYIINIGLRATWAGIDLFTYKCDNHYVDFVVGQIFIQGFRVGSNSTGGKIYNLHFNTQFYANGSETKYGSWPNSPTSDGDATSYAYNYAHFVFMILGNCTNETLYNDFEYGALQGLTLTTDGATGPTGTSLGLGIDGTRNSFNLQGVAAGGFNLINSQIVSLTDAGNTYIAGNAAFTTQVNMFNSDYWGNPPTGVTLTSGILNLQQANFNQPAQTDWAILTGTASLIAQSSAIWPVNALLASGNEPKFSAQSSIIDSSAITRSNTALWKNNLGNAWNYLGGGSPANIPGKILAVNFNAGGPGVAYSGTNSTNNGGQYRPNDEVGIGACSEGGYNVGWINAGEWIKYNVNVTQAGSYTLQVRLASPNSGETIRVLIDNVNISTTGDIAIPNTGGWETWQTVTVITTALTLGNHVMTVNMVNGGFNFEWVNFIYGTPPPAPSITSDTTVSGYIGSAFSYTIAASNNPTGYSATGLPVGLTINDTTGIISGIAASTGTTNVTITATNATGTTSKTLVITFTKSTTESPYGGIIQTIPGEIIAANFDNGGEGVAYHDNDTTNNGGKYRPAEGVDLENSAEGLYDIGWTNTGEWQNYTVNVTKAGTYTLQARVASPGSGNHFHVSIDGTTIGTITVPNTGGNQNWQTASVITSALTLGQHKLQIYFETGGFNLEYLYFLSTPVISSPAKDSGTIGTNFIYTITTSSGNPTSFHATGLPNGLSIDTTSGIISGIPDSIGTFNVTISATNIIGTGSQNLALIFTASTIESPYGGTIAYIPGQIFAYNFDNGGEGVAYHDNNTANTGGQYRPSENVDIEKSSEGIYDVTNTNAGEWMKYTVNISSSGTYTLQARVASPNTGESFHVEINGINISGSIAVPNTGGLQIYQTVTVTTAPLLTTGVQTMRIVEETGGFNIEYVIFSFTIPQACMDGAAVFSVTPAIGNTYQWQVNSGSGFTNIGDDSTYLGINTETLVLFTASSSKYGYQYRCAITNNSNTTYSNPETLEMGDVWTGATSTAWEDPTNWSCGNVPDSNTDVIFNAGTAVVNSNVTVRSLRIYPTVQITVNPSNHFTILH